MSIPIKAEEVILENAEYNSTEELEEELQFQLEDSGGEATSYHIQYADDSSPSRQRSQQQNSNMNTSGASTKSGDNGSTTPGGSKNVVDSEKRMRREIANSNERRRMQSINAGFQTLRSLLPRHEGDKLSKAAILQQTSQYICDLENQKTQLLAQNSQLKRQLGQHESSTGGGSGNDATGNDGTGVTVKKRKLTADNVINIQTISDSSDEGLGSMSPEPMTLLNAAVAGGTTAGGAVSKTSIIAHSSAKELLELKNKLEKERSLRNLLEDELKKIKRQLFSVATAPPASSSVVGSTYIPHEVIEHTDNLMMRDSLDDLPAGTVSYVEIDEMTGQQQVVVCSSIEELESEAAAAAAEIITEDNVHEEVILSTTSSTESETEVMNVHTIAKAYAEGTSSAVLQPILQAAIKATPKVEVERINEAIMKVKTEKIEQPSGLTRSRQNLETIVEAIRHLEGDHLFGDGTDQKHQLHHHHHQHKGAQEAPLALTTTTKQQHHTAQRATLAELRPFLHLKGNKPLMTIVGGSGQTVTVTHQQLAAAKKAATQSHQLQHQQNDSSPSHVTVTPTAIFKVQTSIGGGSSALNASSSSCANTSSAQQVTITTTSMKQCRPGVIVAKQLS